MANTRRATVVSIIGLATALLLPGAVAGHHSIASPLEFWDANDNGVPGPDPDFDHEGPYWSSYHLDRLNAAVVSWSANTDWDPGVANTSQNIFVDGRLAPCIDAWDDPEGTILAVTCPKENARYLAQWGGLYFQIYDADIYFNMERAGAPDWWVGSGVPPQSDRLDFGGCLTHELGHTGGLDHYPDELCVRTSSAWVTMCPFFEGNLDSYWSRSLHADDRESINYAYP